MRPFNIHQQDLILMSTLNLTVPIFLFNMFGSSKCFITEHFSSITQSLHDNGITMLCFGFDICFQDILILFIFIS